MRHRSRTAEWTMMFRSKTGFWEASSFMMDSALLMSLLPFPAERPTLHLARPASNRVSSYPTPPKPLLKRVPFSASRFYLNIIAL
jgi:hypothetical protein